MKLKSLIFFPRTRNRSISGDGDVIFSCHWAFSSLAQHPDCLSAGGPGLTARLAGEQLLLPRRVYLRLAMRIAIIYPSPTSPKTERRNRQAGGTTEVKFILVDTCGMGDIRYTSFDHQFQEMNWINLAWRHAYAFKRASAVALIWSEMTCPQRHVDVDASQLCGVVIRKG